ncbi:DsbA family oxidoreductase [Marinomonas sp. 2405UD68-3]|uniref:DsbA family oxidoreductase n=1 Tax=Marinomonas sp. 2405UD68-3 TaxID=3391835 RepID=UPI0039C93F66
MADFRIDIISDFVCPWSYLGYRRLKQATDQLGDDYRFDIKWQPFELHPDINSQGAEREAYLSKKFDSLEKLTEATHALQQIGIEEGIQFNFTDKDILPNTFLAHRLVMIANQRALGTQLALELYHAYFTDGRNIGDVDVLQDIAQNIGMKSEDIEEAFTEKSKIIIEKKIKRFQEVDIVSAPTYVIDDKFIIHGAHTPDSFFKVLTDIAKNK